MERGEVQRLPQGAWTDYARLFRGVFRRHYPILRVLWVSVDVLIGTAILFLAADAILGEVPDAYRKLAVFSAVVMLGVFRSSGLYERTRIRTTLKEVELLLSNMLVVSTVVVSAGLLTDTLRLFDPQVVVAWLVGAFLAQVGVHLAIRGAAYAARKRSFNVCRALIIGSGAPLRQIHTALAGSPWLGISVEGYVDVSDHYQYADVLDSDPGDRTRRSASISGGAEQPLPRRLGGLDDVRRLVNEYDISSVYVALPADHTTQLPSVVQELLRLNVDVNWAPELPIWDLVSHSVEEVGERPVFCLTRSPLGTGQAALKWLEDKILAVLLLTAVSPLLLTIALAVRLSSRGPALFVQDRHGLDGRVIRVWKFRTMYVDTGSNNQRQATADDVRITPLGKYLRRWSLDELPQLFQVLFGDMSIVGPRPHPLWLDDRYAKVLRGYMQRHRVKPGITGWAQVNGWRGETDSIEKMEMRIRHDLYYINHWSIWFDLKILLMTPTSVTGGKNAY